MKDRFEPMARVRVVLGEHEGRFGVVAHDQAGPYIKVRLDGDVALRSFLPTDLRLVGDEKDGRKAPDPDDIPEALAKALAGVEKTFTAAEASLGRAHAIARELAAMIIAVTGPQDPTATVEVTLERVESDAEMLRAHAAMAARVSAALAVADACAKHSRDTGECHLCWCAPHLHSHAIDCPVRAYAEAKRRAER